MRILNKVVTQCALDKSSNLVSLLYMPKFPLTEFYGKYDPDFPTFDQSLLICEDCGHVQLENQIEPKFLYRSDNYNFRTETSPKILREIDILSEFILDLPLDSKNFSVLEFGANNLVLGTKIKHFFKNYTVCDPILKEIINRENSIEIVDKFIENYITELSSLKYDLILGRHVLEHIADPVKLLKNISSKSKKDIVFVFEVPSFDHLRKKMRFDSVIHQHLHYFDANSVYRLIDRLNGELLSLKYNLRGSNGGSLLFSFIIRKNFKHNNNLTFSRKEIDIKKSNLGAEIKNFRIHFEILSTQLLNSCQPLVGYGASHMLSTFNYHSFGLVEKLIFILDDDLEKINLSYKNLKVKISHPSITSVPDEGIFCITSLENQREILHKIISTYSNNLITGLIL